MHLVSSGAFAEALAGDATGLLSSQQARDGHVMLETKPPTAGVVWVQMSSDGRKTSDLSRNLIRDKCLSKNIPVQQ